MSNTEEIQTLQKLIAKLEAERDEKHNKRKVLGFKLSKLKDGNGTPQWRAYGCYLGKNANIYVGKDPEKAEEKILAWVKKHPHFQPFVTQN